MHGQAGGGLVKVVVKGSGEVIAVTIDPKVVDPGDIETLQDLIVGAMGDASQQVTKMAQDQLGAWPAAWAARRRHRLKCGAVTPYRHV